MKGKEKRSLYAFLMLSFSIPLLCVLLMQYCSIFQNGFLHLLLYGIEAASPSIAAVLVYNSKKHGVRDFLREKWINNESSYLLDSKYFHIVTTIPYELNEIVMYNKKIAIA